ncbi:hypothetical protein BYT27DRAFT_7192545 [Phlegmacium glaucopus]|nr:hypothetical protein BYT27DRAFT_7192545 [Phlegmacium glaucopus]
MVKLSPVTCKPLTNMHIILNIYAFLSLFSVVMNAAPIASDLPKCPVDPITGICLVCSPQPTTTPVILPECPTHPIKNLGIGLVCSRRPTTTTTTTTTTTVTLTSTPMPLYN